MNRKRALYQYEMRNVRWFLLGGLLLCGLLLLSMQSELYALLESRGGVWGTPGYESNNFCAILIFVLQYATPIAAVLLGFMAAFQFSDYHKRTKREFIVSLPYTQQERFLAKLITGLGTITVVWLAFAAGVCGLRVSYYPQLMRDYLLYPEYKIIMANDTWLHTLRTLLLVWLIVLTAYAIYMLIHSVVIHGVLGSLIGIGVMMAPAWLFLVVRGYGETVFSLSDKFSMWFERSHTIKQLCMLFVGEGYSSGIFALDSERYYREGDPVGYFLLFSYGNMTPLFLILTLILLGCLVIVWFVNTRQDGARFGMLVPQKPARWILSAGIAVCMGAGFTWIPVMAAHNMHPFFVILLLLAICAGLFALTNKIFKKVIR